MMLLFPEKKKSINNLTVIIQSFSAKPKTKA